MKIYMLPFVGILFAAVPSHAGPGSGINIQIHDGKVEVDGVGAYVDAQIDAALKNLDHANLPPAVREKVKARIGALREKLKKKLGHLDAKDLDELGEALGEMGEEIGHEMEQMGSDMDQWGKDYAHQMAHDMHRKFNGPDADDDDDDDDMDDAISDLGDLNLKPDQRAAIQKLKVDTEKAVATAKKSLETAETSLHNLLDNPASSDADIAKAIDAVSQQEAAIRKARILAWHAARRVIDDAQRKKVESSVKGHK